MCIPSCALLLPTQSGQDRNRGRIACRVSRRKEQGHCQRDRREVWYLVNVACKKGTWADPATLFLSLLPIRLNHCFSYCLGISLSLCFLFFIVCNSSYFFSEVKHRASSISPAHVLLCSDDEPKLANDAYVFATPFCGISTYLSRAAL